MSKIKAKCPMCARDLNKRYMKLFNTGSIYKCPCGFLFQTSVVRIPDTKEFMAVSNAGFIEPFINILDVKAGIKHA
jgi:hypothetical protein